MIKTEMGGGGDTMSYCTRCHRPSRRNWLYYILISNPNRYMFCLSMCSIHDSLFILILMASFHSQSILVTPTSFLMHVILYII